MRPEFTYNECSTCPHSVRRVRARRKGERSSSSRQHIGEERRGRPSGETTQEDHASRESRRGADGAVPGGDVNGHIVEYGGGQQSGEPQ